MDLFNHNLSDIFKKNISISSFYSKRLDVEIKLLEFLKNYNITIPKNILENLKNNLSVNKIKSLYNSSNVYDTSIIKHFMIELLPNSMSPYISLGISNRSMEEITILLITRNVMITIKDYLQKILVKLNLSHDDLEKGNTVINKILEIEYKLNLKLENNLFLEYLNLDNYINTTEFLKIFDLSISNEEFTTLKNINLIFLELINYFDSINYIHNLNFLIKEIRFKCDLFRENISYNSLFMFIENLKLLLIFLEKINYSFPKKITNAKTNNILKILSVNNIQPNTKQLSLLNDTDQNILIFLENISLSKNIKDFIITNFIDDKEILNNLESIKNQTVSRMGLWNNFWNTRKNKKYQECLIMKYTINFFDIDEIKSIQDWGCGNCKLKNYIPKNKNYFGIDGSITGYQNHISDLVDYKCSCDAIFMKHVLEHNILWKKILLNFLDSFEKRAILIIYTPFSEKTKIIGETIKGINYYNNLVSVEKISFCKKDIIDIIQSCNISFKFEEIESNNEFKKDNIFYLQK